MQRFALLVGSLFVGACSSDAGVTPDVAGEDAVTASKVEYMLVPTTDLELSSTRSAKVAQIKYSRVAGAQAVYRCHFHYVDSGSERAVIIACQTDKVEIIMDAVAGSDHTGFARLRLKGIAGDQFFSCKTASTHEFSPETFGGTAVQKCTPVDRPTAAAKRTYAMVDADPVIDDKPTHNVFLATLWAKTPAQSYERDYAPILAKAIPDGEYKGYGSSSSHPCKVKVKTENKVTNIQILKLEEGGGDGAVQAKVDVSEASVSGGVVKDGIKQEVASTARPAKVLIVNAESDTTTTKYFSRNVRVVRFPDATGEAANADSGHSAVYIDDNYCQRLDPAIAAW